MYHTILDNLIAADLPASTERVAIRLLQAAHEETGSLTLSWDDYLALAHNKNVSAARRHLTALSKAGVLHYSTNELIYVQFLAWTDIETARPRAVSVQDDTQTARPRAVSMQDDTQTARPRAVSMQTNSHDTQTARPRAVSVQDDTQTARPRAVSMQIHTRAHTRAIGGGGGGGGDPSTTQPIRSTTTTNHPPGIRQRLSSFGLNPDQIRIHMSLTVHDVTTILDAWERDLQAGKVGVGALLHRLQNAVTPLDTERLMHKNYRPAEYNDVIH